MKEYLTRKGILVDICSYCQGVWLDQGELNFFCKDRKIINDYEREGLQKLHESSYQCPKCHSGMLLGKIPGLSYQVEECQSCKGLFFDAHEFKKISQSKIFETLKQDSSINLEETKLQTQSAERKKFSSPKAQSLSKIPFKLPSLGFTTALVCSSLYGILFAVIVFLMEMAELSVLAGASTIIGFVVLQFIFSPWIMDWQLKFFGSLDWVGLEGLPPYLQKSLKRLCKENSIPLPTVGIIEDSSPQAYTYGRTPYSARLVFSRGIFELLDEEEAEAVLAHELGHIKHWDFVIMTVIRVVPLLLYIIYRNIKSFLFRKQGSKKDGRGTALLAMALVVSYLAYLIADYMVLFVSRIREYYADKFSCFATKKPNKLLTALVKISYGLLSQRPADEEDESYEDHIKGVESFNIMNISHSKEMALSQYQTEESAQGFNPSAIQNIMRWDLWSPWAFYYELHSTHPLTAKRINAIGSYAKALNQEPYLVFKKEKPESYWDDFFGDIFVLLLPYILGLGAVFLWFWHTGIDYTALVDKEKLAGADMDPVKLLFELAGSNISRLFGYTLLGISLGAFVRTLKTYPGGSFLFHSVSSLLKLIKVSPVRSYPVTLKGYILGRGDAGNIFSEDFMLRDKTGIIFLNHEPFGLNILFALFRYQQFQGRNVIVTGWYRRSPSPYLEVRSIQTEGGDRSWAYTYYYKMGFCFLSLIIGLVNAF